MATPTDSSPIPTLDLNDGRAIPQLGLGIYAMNGPEGVDAIVNAVDTVGYRLLDTAVNYENEREVGEAVANSAVDREKLFVTSKIPGRHHGFDESIASTEESLARLGLDYLDLHLIHWPNPSVGKYVETWRGLIELRERGLVKSIGVSNFTEAMLTELIDATGVTPAVNQVELHPYFPQADLIAFHRTIGVQTEAWSPLYRDQGLFDEAPIAEAAAAHGVTPAQVVLRWHLQIGSLPIPKSANPDRQATNADVFDFSLTPAEVDAISALERGRMKDRDPLTHEEM
ncbi:MULTISPECIES: aldo/keto reductase [unclassified Brevibacterium]|jgi:2,5-diketo-D-gluconate reductase A|uniref:aldo/keto reductase n=1 Tax=unclassified Brevibacterium TaxID=2614124 RepID=UPI001BA5C23D|nr:MULTISPECIES: aldo/keto reductase [unclassified Brevibacterium]QUL78778.1 aldo/keto reductase [Brevibacterium sp. SMBL_HHYL_HB1]